MRIIPEIPILRYLGYKVQNKQQRQTVCVMRFYRRGRTTFQALKVMATQQRGALVSETIFAAPVTTETPTTPNMYSSYMFYMLQKSSPP